jgi:hypothetical protein
LNYDQNNNNKRLEDIVMKMAQSKLFANTVIKTQCEVKERVLQSLLHKKTELSNRENNQMHVQKNKIKGILL